MKATFKNIGPIKQAELELGDLTVIAGQNDTGKTYLVYTLYGFLKFLQDDDYRFRYSPDELLQKLTPNSEQLIQEIIDTGKATMGIGEYKKIKDKLNKFIVEYFSGVHIDSTFGSPRGQFKKATFNFELGTNKSTAKERVYQELSTEARIENNKLVFEDKLFGYHTESSKRDLQESFAFKLSRLLLKIARKQHPEPYIRSSERFGISLFYKELDFKKNKLVEELQNWSNERGLDPFIFLEEESARYAKPIKDNIDFTRDLSRIRQHKSTLTPDKKRSIRSMLSARFEAASDEIRFISTKKGEARFDIPLYLASSSARGLSDLYFYLRHVAKPGQLLIIDEPESHLSPRNQVLMARLLAFCVNKGIKVLITTHSDYLIKEINNLIMLHGEFEEKEDFLKRHKKDYTENDSLNPDTVRAYVCENGGLTRCDIDSMGTNMPVFDDAIDKINKISNELALIRMPDEHD